MSNRWNVTVHLNESRNRFLRYVPGDLLVEVAQFDVPGTSPQEAADLVFMLCNIDGPGDLPAKYEDQAAAVKAYRENRNRSLSVADVLLVTDGSQTSTLSVENFGFKEVAADLNVQKRP